MTLEKFQNSLSEAQEQRLADLGFTPEEFVDAYNEHEHDYHDESPSVYCGTWGKYNGGDLTGQWIDLTTFSDYDDFLGYCLALHADEYDPELMFQDYEYFPEEWYDEWISEAAFNNIIAYTEMCDKHGRDAVDAYISITGNSDCSGFEEAYQGEWDSEEAFAEQFADDCGYLSQIPDSLRYYFDFAAFARDLFMDGYSFESGYVFLDR